MPTQSVTGLKRLYRGNSTARMLFDWLASRDRNRESTNFNRIMSVMMGQNEPPTRARMREVFRTLEKLGFGKFVVGRRGHPTRFIWSTPLTEVGTAARIPVKLKGKAARAAKVKAVKAVAPTATVVKRGPGRPRKEQIAA